MFTNTILKFDKDYLNHKYGLIHFNFFVQYARIAGVQVELVDPSDKIFIADDKLIFSCLVNDQQIIVDYADHATKNWQTEYPDVPYFKFQSNHPLPTGCVPLGPPMVGIKRRGTQGATMREYNQVRFNYNYTPGQAVLCKQLPNGAATERRNLVQGLIQQNFINHDVSADCDQMDFWRVHENCLTAVCVPGATNNMVDRGQMELMGLGVCTVSPRLDTVFAYGQLLEPGVHYIQCKDDYTDLVDILKQLQIQPELCKTIGSNARTFYDKYYTPIQYWKWIMENLR